MNGCKGAKIYQPRGVEVRGWERSKRRIVQGRERVLQGRVRVKGRGC